MPGDGREVRLLDTGDGIKVKRAIEPVLPAHRGAMLHILTSAGVFSPKELAVAEEVLDSYLRDGEKSGYLAYLLVEGDAPAGYVCFGPTPMTQNTWDIYWLAVHPAKQRLGIGAELLSFAQNLIEERDGRLILVETSSRPDYESARKLYLSLGFKVECGIKDFYSPGDNKLIFSKRLS